MATRIPDKDEIKMHYDAMQGGDDTVTYSETGEIVIPVAVQQKFPQIAQAALQAIGMSGGNPSQYVVGSPEGNYNKMTGAQQFNWWEDLLDYGKTAADYVANNDWAQAALTGAATAGLSKLSGADTKAALAAGAGAGLGYYATDKIGQGVSNLANKKDFMDGMFDAGTIKSATGAEAFGNLATSFNPLALSAAGVGGSIGLAMGTDEPDLPNYNTQGQQRLDLPQMANMNDIYNDIEDNEIANMSATLPQNLPIAPMNPAAIQSVGGVSYKRKVKDRDTGKFKYVDEDESSSPFAQGVARANRRRGFGGKVLFA